MGIKCPKCNTDNPDTQKFCGECATPLPSSKEIPVTETLETPVEELSRGATFAKRYELIEELGRGGMGRVYKVFDKKIKEEVALKLIKPEIASDEKTVERFSNELKFARKIIHKNVGRMYELMEDEGTHYITMEYVAGEDLRSFIRRVGQLPIGKSISVAKQICDGLAEAHRLGVVHRDLKPGNIMIDSEGNARILDFGIARSLKTEGITTKGVVVGTPDYMSPEQVDGKEADQRSDIYSLGIIFYEMLTSKVPFEGDTSFSVALKHKTEMPKDPREFNTGIPDYLSRLILKCMEKKREDRYQSVTEIVRELEPVEIKEEKKKVKERGKLHELLVTPIKLKRRIIPEKLKIGRIKFLKYSIRASILLLIVYGIISAIGLINDAIYNERLKQIKVERYTYYKYLFPIQKEWLPEEWKTRDYNACSIYMKMFYPYFDEEGNFIPAAEVLISSPPIEELNKIFKYYEYNNPQELKNFIKKYENFYQFDELFDVVRCNKLDFRIALEKDPMINTDLALKYIKMIILDARVDFLEGNYEKGLMKIHSGMILSLDLSLFSSSLYSDLVTIPGFRWLYLELIPLFLSAEKIHNQNYIEYIEKLISLTLEKFEPESANYKAYLWIAIANEVYGYEGFGISKFHYYLYEKLYFWKNGFSWNQYLYEAAKFYQGLFEGLKYIRNLRDKSIYMKEYFEKNPPGDHWFIPSFEVGPFKYNIVRTLGKVVIIISTIKRHGIDSPEFLELKGTDIFINELSGRRFEFIDEGDETYIILDKDYKLSLKELDYQKHYKQILKSFEHFELKSMKQIRSLFYSFEME